MENRQYLYQLFVERGFISVSTAAKELGLNIDDAANLLAELLQSAEVSGIYSFYESGRIKLIKNPQCLEGSTLFAISKCEQQPNSFRIEYANQRAAMKSHSLIYPPSKIGPFLQSQREFQRTSMDLDVKSPPVRKEIPVIAPQVNPEKNNVLRDASQAQITFKKADKAPEILKTPEKVVPIQNKINYSAENQKTIPRSADFQKPVENPKISFAKAIPKQTENSEIIEKMQIEEPSKPITIKSKPKTKSGFNDILSSSIYTVEEEDRMDVEPEPTQSPLKRKLQPEEKGIKKMKLEQQQPSPQIKMPEGPRMKHVKVTVSKTYIDEKGRLVTEDVVEDHWEEVTDPEPTIRSTQILGFKKGTQSNMQSFLVKST